MHTTRMGAEASRQQEAYDEYRRMPFADPASVERLLVDRRLVPADVRFRHAGLGYATDARPPLPHRDVWLMMCGQGSVLGVHADPLASPPHGIRW